MTESSKLKRIIVDVREPSEYLLGHVEGAINIPPAELLSGARALHNIDRDVEIVLYCVSGSRSNSAIHILRSLGFTNLINGINADHVTKKYFFKREHTF